jgi:hypothetical protein
MEAGLKDRPPKAQTPVQPIPAKQQEAAKPPRVAPPAIETQSLSG